MYGVSQVLFIFHGTVCTVHLFLNIFNASQSHAACIYSKVGINPGGTWLADGWGSAIRFLEG